MSITSPRVRFAPSPTGYLHIGGLRTALYNYLFAKNLHGKIMLRIEDTDRKRFVEGAVENLLQTLDWAGIDFDEGPGIGGESGPYFQSQRLDIYKKYAEELISKGMAYYCFCTPERLKTLREKQQEQKLPQAKYDKLCLNLSKKEIDDKLNSDITKVVRLNVNPYKSKSKIVIGIKILKCLVIKLYQFMKLKKTLRQIWNECNDNFGYTKKVAFDDVIRGRVEFDSKNIDDQVLIKSDGFPTYHLANVVDDHLMGITHVIRGEEWLSSTPKHVLLYEYLGWEKPVFAHLPLLLNPDKSKLSKRQGDVAVEDYRDKGFLKEALINFVALLGWNPGDEQEFFTMEELINKFTLERVHKAGAVFNIEKLTWLNAEHLRSKPNDELLLMLKDELAKSYYKDKVLDDDYLLLIIEAMKPRVSFVNEFITNCTYFYAEPTEYDEKSKQKKLNLETLQYLERLEKAFRDIYSKNKSEDGFESYLCELGEKYFERTNDILIKNKDKYTNIFNRTSFDRNFIRGEWAAFSSFITKVLNIESKHLLKKERLFRLENNKIRPELLYYYLEMFGNIWNPTKEEYEIAMKSSADNLNIGLGKLIHPLRLAVSGQTTGPGMFDILFILGKNEVIKRINAAKKEINIPKTNTSE